MNPNHAAQTYRQSSVENAPPIKIVRMLFEGALRFIDRAAACDPATQRREFAQWIGRADAILSELRIALEREPSPELAGGLEQVYEFAQWELAQALARGDIQPLASARKVLATLLEGWRSIELETVGTTS